MQGHHLSFSELLSTCSVGSQGKLFLVHTLGVAGLVVCIRYRVVTTFLARIPSGGCATLQACPYSPLLQGKGLRLSWGMPHSTQGYPSLLHTKQRPGIFIFEPAYHLAQKYRLSKTRLLFIVVISHKKLYISAQIFTISSYGTIYPLYSIGKI